MNNSLVHQESEDINRDNLHSFVHKEIIHLKNKQSKIDCFIKLASVANLLETAKIVVFQIYGQLVQVLSVK